MVFWQRGTRAGVISGRSLNEFRKRSLVPKERPESLFEYEDSLLIIIIAGSFLQTML